MIYLAVAAALIAFIVWVAALGAKLDKQRTEIMTALETITAAVNNAIAEMNNAAANYGRDDPALLDAATRLQAASDALHAVAQPPAPVASEPAA